MFSDDPHPFVVSPDPLMCSVCAGGANDHIHARPRGLARWRWLSEARRIAADLWAQLGEFPASKPYPAMVRLEPRRATRKVRAC